MNKLNWSVIGHQKILDFLEAGLQNQRLAHAYLFTGPQKVGKTLTAKRLINFLVCKNYQSFEKKDLDLQKLACQECEACQQLQKGIYPDFYLLERELDIKKDKRKKNITVSQVRDLQKQIQKHSFANSYKVVLIPQAEALSEAASNSLLKILEEPTPKTVFILIAPNKDNLLPTIQSRCQHINFSPVRKDDIYNYLLQQGANRDLAKELSSLSVGRPTQAMHFLSQPSEYEEYKTSINELIDLLNWPNYKKFIFFDDFTKKHKNSADIVLMLDKIGTVLRDFVLLKNYHEEQVTNVFAVEKLKQTRLTFAPEKLLNRLTVAKKLLEQNISPKFLLENIFLI